jgi:hypothetical protein
MDDERTEQLKHDFLDNDDISRNSNEEAKNSAKLRAEQYYSEKNAENAKRRQLILQRTLAMSGIVGAGLMLIFSSLQRISIIDFLLANGQVILGTAIIGVAMIYFVAPNIFSVANFRDVDLRRREKTVLSPAAAWPFPTTTSPTYDDEDNEPELETDEFKRYFLSISKLLQEKAFDAEEKASLLLDKGSNYTLAGIVFFIVSIIAWQIMAWIHGFKTEFIYGIASCSGLFVFIEILSGWYLKQYRHYVDTSTYLLKIKSMFDKFMLAYLSQHSLSDNDAAAKRLANKTLLSMLEKEIRWPNAYMLKRADANFAIEAVEALSKISKRLSKKDKKSKEPKGKKD